jgi:hypothetical protein
VPRVAGALGLGFRAWGFRATRWSGDRVLPRGCGCRLLVDLAHRSVDRLLPIAPGKRVPWILIGGLGPLRVARARPLHHATRRPGFLLEVWGLSESHGRGPFTTPRVARNGASLPSVSSMLSIVWAAAAQDWAVDGGRPERFVRGTLAAALDGTADEASISEADASGAQADRQVDGVPPPPAAWPGNRNDALADAEDCPTASHGMHRQKTGLPNE